MQSNRLQAQMAFPSGTPLSINTGLSYTTSDKNYKLVLNKTTKKSRFIESSFNYICKIDIYSNLDTLIESLILNENDILLILDTFYSAIENNLQGVRVPIYNYNSFGNIKSLYLEYEYDIYGNSIYTISLIEYNSSTETVNKRLPMKFTYIDLNQFLELLYDTFLVGIDINPQIYDQLISGTMSDINENE